MLKIITLFLFSQLSTAKDLNEAVKIAVEVTTDSGEILKNEIVYCPLSIENEEDFNPLELRSRVKDRYTEVLNMTYETLLIDNLKDNSLVKNIPKDIELFCPNFHELDDKKKSEFWAHLISNIAFEESRLKSKKSFTIKNVKKSGILQISLEDQIQKEECQLNKETIYSDRENIKCAIKIMKKLLKEDQNISSSLSKQWDSLKESVNGQPGKLNQIKNSLQTIYTKDLCNNVAPEVQSEKRVKGNSNVADDLKDFFAGSEKASYSLGKLDQEAVCKSINSIVENKKSDETKYQSVHCVTGFYIGLARQLTKSGHEKFVKEKMTCKSSKHLPSTYFDFVNKNEPGIIKLFKENNLGITAKAMTSNQIHDAFKKTMKPGDPMLVDWNPKGPLGRKGGHSGIFTRMDGDNFCMWTGQSGTKSKASGHIEKCVHLSNVLYLHYWKIEEK